MSRLVLIGINHKTAPIELRERVAISRDELPDATRALAAMPGVTECMIVSTCNRVEMLAAVDSPDTDLTTFLHHHFGLDQALLAPHIYQHRDQQAVRHLFRVASSLDSMVVGEPQILGQVKEAFAPPAPPAPSPDSLSICSSPRSLQPSAFAPKHKLALIPFPSRQSP
jgi:glutamyl-tRNA reductase